MSKSIDISHDGQCLCGCGGLTKIATRTRGKLGHIKGQPQRYIRGHRPKNIGPYKKVDPIERFKSFIVADPANGCHCFTRLSKHGYGMFSVNRRHVHAHRWLWEFVHGVLPRHIDIDHLCRNRSCVNLEHLEPVTRKENIRRGIGPMLIRLRNAERTHCKHGHAFTPENTYIRKRPGGGRHCVMCIRIHTKQYREKQRRERAYGN